MRVTTLLPALASAALLLSGTAALARQTAPASTTAEESGGAAPAPAAKPKKEKKICRDNANSYSHMGGRVCKTQAEWDNGSQTREIDSHVRSVDPNN